MSLPFTSAEFFGVFEAYNRAVWPAQLLLLAAAVTIAGLALAGVRRAFRWTMYLLGALWLWMGVVYHALFFRDINPAAVAFAIVFVVQGLLLLAASRSQATMVFRRDTRGYLGLGLIIYALMIYPALGYTFGHRYPATPTFGLPCPTTLFTLGTLLWLEPSKLRLFVIPISWAVIASTAALRLHVYEDAALAAAAILVTLVFLRDVRERNAKPAY